MAAADNVFRSVVPGPWNTMDHNGTYSCVGVDADTWVNHLIREYEEENEVTVYEIEPTEEGHICMNGEASEGLTHAFHASPRLPCHVCRYYYTYAALAEKEKVDNLLNAGVEVMEDAGERGIDLKQYFMRSEINALTCYTYAQVSKVGGEEITVHHRFLALFAGKDRLCYPCYDMLECNVQKYWDANPWVMIKEPEEDFHFTPVLGNKRVTAPKDE